MAEARYFNVQRHKEGEIFMQETGFKEKDCMSLEGFAICLKLDIQKKMGKEFKLTINDVVKNNDTKLKALLISREGCNVSPTIYLNDFYSQYVDGRGLGEIESDIINCYQNCDIPNNMDFSFFMDWEKVKKMVTYKLVNFKNNMELLKDVPYRKILDLAIVYECPLFGSGVDGAITIRSKHLAVWGVSEDELYTAAFRNTPELMGYTFMSLFEVMLDTIVNRELGMDTISLLPDMAEAEKGNPHMYVLSNKDKFHGAGCILYKNLLMEIAEKWGCDICIIPSSIHEVLLIPMREAGSCEYISLMISEVNQTQLEPDEILSEHPYQFCRETGEIIIQGGKEYE